MAYEPHTVNLVNSHVSVSRVPEPYNAIGLVLAYVYV